MIIKQEKFSENKIRHVYNAGSNGFASRVALLGCLPRISHVFRSRPRRQCRGLFQEYVMIRREHRESNMGANPQREIEIDKDGEEDTETERPSAFPRPPRKLTFARRAHYLRDHTFFHCHL